MTSSTLKFGPEWLRNLSDGSVSAIPSSSTTSISTTSHVPSSQAGVIGTTQRYKLADYRYGREEMLALFAAPIPVPENLKELKVILSDRLQQPLALQPETDDEQHLFSQPVNSTAVLRMTGRGSAVPPGGLRTEVDRGRGRGRGRSEVGGFYPRVPIEEDSFSRGSRISRDIPDTDSRGRGFGYTGRSFDDMSTSSSSHGEFSRSMSTENWRMSRKYEDNEGSWRKPIQRSTSRRWREPWEKSSEGDRERMVDRRMSEDSYRDRSVPSYRRSFSSNSAYDEESDLPEWSTDDVDDIGTFDSSGAFMSLKDLEQQEKKERRSQEADSQRDEAEDECNVLAVEKANLLQESAVNELEFGVSGTDTVEQDVPPQQEQQVAVEVSSSDNSYVEVDDLPKASEVPNANGTAEGAGQQSEDGAIVSDQLAMEGGLTLAAEPGSNCASGVGEGQEAEVNFDHLELQVENLYASMSADEEPLSTKEKGFLPPNHEDAKKWFYRDPQGQVQGPFSSGEMAEWFSAGYFSMNLVVKQGADECFVPLGELIKKMGSVPFIAAAPVKISPPQSNSSNEMQHHQDQLKLLLLQQQQQQQQQQIQQQLRTVQTQEAFAKLTPQQQQLLLQMMLKQQLNPQVPAAPVSQQQQQQKTNALNRSTLLETMNAFQRLSSTVSSHPSANVPPSFHRSMSQPSGIDISTLPSSLLYGLSTSSASSAAGTANNLPSVGVQSSGALWRSSSCMPSASGQPWLSESGAGSGGLWNVELPKAITASALEEMQYMVLEKAHQQQHQQQVPTPAAVSGHHQLKLQELLEARAGAEKHRDANGSMGLDQIRELLQQQKQQLDIVRLAEEQRRLLEEKRRMLEMNPLDRQRLVRQDRSEELYRQQQQLDALCRLQSDPVMSSLQDRDAMDVRQLLALQQSWTSSQNRGHGVPSGSGLVTPSAAAALFHHKDNGPSSSSSATAASIIQQELINKHLKLNDMKTAMNQWPVTSGASANRWANEPGTWTGSILPPSKSSPLNWETATVSANNKSINSSVPYVPVGLSSQMKQEYVQKVHKSKEELTQWCENVLKSMLTCSSMDIPTFICHLMDLSSAAEVNQFVQAYLGDTDDAKKFVKQFVEKQNRIQQEALLMQYMSSQGGNPW